MIIYWIGSRILYLLCSSCLIYLHFPASVVFKTLCLTVFILQSKICTNFIQQWQNRCYSLCKKLKYNVLLTHIVLGCTLISYNIKHHQVKVSNCLFLLQCHVLLGNPALRRSQGWCFDTHCKLSQLLGTALS